MAKNRFETKLEVEPTAAPETSATAVAATVSDELTATVLPQFNVTYQDKTEQVPAANKLEAWALFCDRNKIYPSPKLAKIEAL